MRSFFLLSVLIFSSSALAEFRIGARSSYFSELNKSSNSFLFIETDYTYEDMSSDVIKKYHFDVRAMDYFQSNENLIVDPTNLSVELLGNRQSFQIGFLRYRFSETFGIQLLDIANPRDYSEFLINDLSWAKRSVFGLNHSFKWARSELQSILTLWSHGDRLPYKGSAFNESGLIQGGEVDRPWFKDPEYGFRLKHLFDNGLDLSFLYFHHFARTIPGSDSQVDSLGLSFSYVLEDWVLRGDNLLTFNDPLQNDIVSNENKDHIQALLGIDRVWESFTLGLQTQIDFTQNFAYIGSKFEWNTFENWKPSLMIFKSAKDTDYWFQVKNDFSFDRYDLSLIYDQLHGQGDLFGLYDDHDRILTQVTVRF